MKIKTNIIKTAAAAALLLLALALCGCGSKEIIRNNAGLSLDLGIGKTHFEDESDYPAPDEGAYLDVNASKIVIRGAYGENIIETPFIYNNSSTAYPRMKLEIYSNKMFVIYCPDISMPSIQFASTDDGGTSWTQSTLSLKSEMDTIDNFVATFWTPRNGALIAVDGTINTFIYITEDGGKTWQKQEEAPPEQDWHDLLEYGTFLSRDIGIISYDFHSKAANEPNVYLTTDGGKSWRPLYVVVPDSVMDAYAKAGKPFYDGEKINIPINIYNDKKEITNTVYFVSYDLAQTWKFYVDDGGKSEQLRLDEMQKWVQENRVEALLFADYEVTKFAEYASIELDEATRIDIYSVEIAYNIGDKDWSRFKLTYQMYFDDQMRLYCRSTTGTPLLFFIYRGDVFNYTYDYLGSMGQKTFEKQNSESVLEKMIAQKETEDEITEMIGSALAYYPWFTPYVTTDIANPEESITFEGNTYFKAILPEIATMAELEALLGTTFTEKAVRSILEFRGDNGEQIFAEENGMLYRLGNYTSEHTDIDVQFSYEIAAIEDKSATVTFTINKTHEGDDVDISYDCRLEKTDEGWRVSTFKSPIEFLTESYTDSEAQDDAVITDIANWVLLGFEGDDAVRQLVSAMIGGNYFTMAQILGGSAVNYIQLGPVTDGAYSIARRTEGDAHVIVVRVNDTTNNKYYTKYIRHTETGITISDS